MIGSPELQRAFLGMSAFLGEPREAVTASLGDDEAWAAAPSLQSSSRDVRARSLAAVLAQVVSEIDAMGLT